jgi:Pyruvate/2-oxoacid:ferredoxin oxidoreductase delta subunit
MSEEIYRQLAQRLDAIPNGYPATESGVELRLLEKMFTPQEAALAVVMRLMREPAGDIADRAGTDLDTAQGTLKGMARNGLIRSKRVDGELTFGLLPFAVGIYEEQLPRMDSEFAVLVEQYFQETQGGFVNLAPSVHRVVPVGEAVPFDLEIFPHERATALVESAKSWGVRDCICRVQQRMIDKGCEHEVESCLVFAPVENAFEGSEINRPISKTEALQLLHDAEEAGLVHTTANHRERHYYICNCCTCCCGILRGVTEFDIPTAVARSDFRAVVDVEVCSACEDCLERCQFRALSIPEDVCVVDEARCVGCGVCVIECSTGALSMTRRPEGQVPAPPADIKDWMWQRAEAREISIFEVL